MKEEATVSTEASTRLLRGERVLIGSTVAEVAAFAPPAARVVEEGGNRRGAVLVFHVLVTSDCGEEDETLPDDVITSVICRKAS